MLASPSVAQPQACCGPQPSAPALLRPAPCPAPFRPVALPVSGRHCNTQQQQRGAAQRRASTATAEVGGVLATAQFLDAADETEASTFCGADGKQLAVVADLASDRDSGQRNTAKFLIQADRAAHELFQTSILKIVNRRWSDMPFGQTMGAWSQGLLLFLCRTLT